MLAELHLDAASAPANRVRGPAKPASKGRPPSEEGTVTRSHMQVWSLSSFRFSILLCSTWQCAGQVMSKLSTCSHPASHRNMHAAELHNDMRHLLGQPSGWLSLQMSASHPEAPCLVDHKEI